MKNQEREVKLKDIKRKIHKLEEEKRQLERGCRHIIVRKFDTAICNICKIDFGWYCPKAPDHVCHYVSEIHNTRRYVELINGKKHFLPADHDYHGESMDWCIFCDEPSERK